MFFLCRHSHTARVSGDNTSSYPGLEDTPIRAFFGPSEGVPRRIGQIGLADRCGEETLMWEPVLSTKDIDDVFDSEEVDV